MSALNSETLRRTAPQLAASDARDARSYAPLVAGRDKFADKAFPPGPGRFTGTFDFESPPVRPLLLLLLPHAPCSVR